MIMNGNLRFLLHHLHLVHNQEAALAVLRVKIDNRYLHIFEKHRCFYIKVVGTMYIVHRHTYKSRAFIARCTGVKYAETFCLI